MIYLETVDEIDCAAKNKIERKAKERVIVLLHDERVPIQL